MGQRDPRVDAYIARSADFARPLLEHIRDEMHRYCPDLKETIKWGFPHFEYKGILASMAAFKAHCALSFWKGALLEIDGKSTAAMGQFGCIAALMDLPGTREMARLIKTAMVLNDEGVQPPARSRTGAPKSELLVPQCLADALKQNGRAQKTFGGFSHTNKKDYADWISEAKTDVTRDKRLVQAIEWLAEGKVRNWKYLRK